MKAVVIRRLRLLSGRLLAETDPQAREELKEAIDKYLDALTALNNAKRVPDPPGDGEPQQHPRGNRLDPGRHL